MNILEKAEGHIVLGSPTIELFKALQEKPEVSSIVVVVPESEAAEYIGTIDDEKSVVVVGDVLTWDPGYNFQFNMIYVDIELAPEQFEDLRHHYQRYCTNYTMILRKESDVVEKAD